MFDRLSIKTKLASNYISLDETMWTLPKGSHTQFDSPLLCTCFLSYQILEFGLQEIKSMHAF